MDRVIAGQRDIAKRGGSPYQYSIYVHPEHYEMLAPHLGSTVLLVEKDASVPVGAIVLRHEVRA